MTTAERASRHEHDLITVGRVNLDLVAQDVGAAFADISGFDATVGGSPTNIAIAASRLGLRTLAFTAVGDDRVGDLVLRNLRDEGVETDHVPRKAGRLTSLALLGVQPPDRFPLSFYRQDPADIHLTVADAEALPFERSRSVLLSGNAFSRGTCVAAARFCAQQATRLGLTTFADLDLRPSDWPEPAAFGLTLRSVLPEVDVAIGTEEEWFAALADRPDAVMEGRTIPHDDHDELDELLRQAVAAGTVDAVVLKRGDRGVRIITADARVDVPGFGVEPVNTVGAGDAFAAGLITSRLEGRDWYQAARYANACGAIEVSRHGCSTAFPTASEVTTFVDEHGGL